MGQIFTLNKTPFAVDTVTLTGGYFDLLHAGHVMFLNECKKFGGDLVVGVLSDQICRRVKCLGKNRPIIGEKDRVYLVSQLSCVDYAFIQKDLYTEKKGFILTKIRPIRIVFPSEWVDMKLRLRLLKLIHEKFPRIQVVTINRQRADISTTRIIAKIQSQEVK